MSSKSAHEPFWAQLPLIRNLYQQHPRHTDETPVVQSFRIVHQDEARRMQNRFLAWCDDQPVLRPRLVTETQPKLRERAGHIQEITPQIVAYRPRTTDGMQQLPVPHTPIPEAHKEAERVQKFDPSQLPPWIQALRDGSLLVSGQESAIDETKDTNLMTLRPDSVSQPLPKIDINGNTLAMAHQGRRSQPLPGVPGRDELPTTPGLNKLIEQALPPFIGGGEMPPVEQQPFPEHSWLNSVTSSPAETPTWVEPAPPVLVPMNRDGVAAQDRIATSRLDDDDTLHVMRAVKPAKESEEK